MFVKIKKLHPDAQIPAYATDGAACFDLHSVSDVKMLGPYRPETFATGLAFAVPDDHVMLIFSRSGHGFKHGIRLCNCVGVIDSDYRGEILARLTADEYGTLRIAKGDRVAQAMILPVKQVQFAVCDDLPETIRGQNGFGSTGA